MQIQPLDATLGAVVTGVRLAELSDAEWEDIEPAFHTYAVLVFPGQHLSAAEQIAFARRFGDIETLAEGYDAVPISTVDRTGAVMDAEHPVMQVVRGNQHWHTDSSYMPVSAKASMLSAKVVTAAGGQTEWADMRAAYDALDDETRGRISKLCAHHSIAYSRHVLGFEFSDDEQNMLKGAVHPLVRTIPRPNRKSLYVASHASRVMQWPVPEGRLLLRELIEHATQPEFVYRHQWRVGDLVIWDNRCTMHRARSFEDTTHRRELRRVTTLDIPATV